MSIVTDPKLKQYNKLSRYANFPFYYHTVDKKYIYGTTEWLKENTAYQSYRIKDGDTLDTIALQAYNNPTLYWVIADFNRIQDPFIKLPAGYIIRIPVISDIDFRS